MGKHSVWRVVEGWKTLENMKEVLAESGLNCRPRVEVLGRRSFMNEKVGRRDTGLN